MFGHDSWKVLAAVVLATCCGCGDASKRPATKEVPASGTTKTTAIQVESVTAQNNGKYIRAKYETWPMPAFALALSGEMHGYIEPCGCADPQYGGIARRDDLLRQVREKGWEVAGLDLGGTLKNARLQSQFKFQTLLSALKDMQYRALVVGTEELKLGAGYLLSQDAEPEAGQEQTALRFMAANLTFFGSNDLPTPIRQRVFTIGGKKIGLTAIYDPALKAKLGNFDPNEITISDPAPAIRTALEKLKAEKPDLLVLLCHGTPAESRKLAEQFPEFQLVATTSPVEEPMTDNPVLVGDTVLVTVGHKGKFLGLLGVYPDEKPSFRFDLVQLDGDRFKNSKRMVEHMQFYQDMLKDSKLAETEPALHHPRGDKYVGAEKCGECHTKAFAKWKETGHAKGFESLKTGRLGISRTNDPECLSCHSTGWHPQDVLRYESGYENATKTAHLFGNQCENCHGPGSHHIELIEADKIEEAKKITHLVLAEAEKNVCSNCHDNDNSPKFKFEEYWKKIAHPWRD